MAAPGVVLSILIVLRGSRQKNEQSRQELAWMQENTPLSGVDRHLTKIERSICRGLPYW